MDKIVKEAYKKHTTIYSLIRRIIDFYDKNNKYGNCLINSFLKTFCSMF